MQETLLIILLIVILISTLPIVTNTETASIMNTASLGETTDSRISIYPNPANSFIMATVNNAIEHQYNR
ncbi:hypothetical protein [uncultured Nonlabens sp.]|uniref:hypothetical protein n=1 Tax=uncultured Nonlabens sp. TaxID=859306 RepID=UPI00262169D1|nr:hypothetical protein [uncultured Nonlabens sp.]